MGEGRELAPEIAQPILIFARILHICQQNLGGGCQEPVTFLPEGARRLGLICSALGIHNAESRDILANRPAGFRRANQNAPCLREMRSATANACRMSTVHTNTFDAPFFWGIG